MPRRTVTIDKRIEDKLRDLQASLITSTHKDWSFTKIVNLVVLGGLLASRDFDERTWHRLKNFLEGNDINLDPDIVYSYANKITH